MKLTGCLFALTLSLTCSAWCTTAQAGDWAIPEDALTTRWAGDVSPENALPEYPRPQMVRKEWQNLNGLWELEVTPRDAEQPAEFTDEILVPYPIESALSGVRQRVGANERIWYRRTFEVPAEWAGQRLLLHFGAVDWETVVSVNGQELATHRGGYDGFTVDVTEALTADGPQELVVAVWDPTDAGGQPRGKQVSTPGGIMYTPTSGIWQTVWLEPVAESHIESLTLTPDLENSCMWVTVDAAGGTGAEGTVHVLATEDEDELEVAVISGAAGERLKLEIPTDRLHLWTPESPFLYDLTVTLSENGEETDRAKSYFGMRSIDIGADENGVTRIRLNGEPYFMVGPLDQGFWPDGLYTAPTDEALRYDIEVTKELGFNMTRKHVKVEPARWYYWCDKLGLIVIQDMPNGDNDSDTDKAQYRTELTDMIDQFRNHPSIVMWVPFNEGWGQHETPEIVDLVRELDPSRLVNQASGWHDRGVGDVHDIHHYPNPHSPDPEPHRAAMLGEFGGLGLPVPDHAWPGTGWGYAGVDDGEDLAVHYEEMLATVAELIESPGLSAAVYTQITDVETEVNGLLSYDREVIKAPTERIAKANEFYFPPSFGGATDQFVAGTTLPLRHAREDAVIRYTLDGSEPTVDSPEYTQPLELADGITVTARAFWDDGLESAGVARTFEEVKPRAAASVEGAQPGLRCEYYEGAFATLPNFAELEPVATSVVDRVDLGPAQREDNFALRFTGYVEVPADGVYTFYLTSDDGSLLAIGDQLVINNDGLHALAEKRGHIALAAGLHPITLTFFEAEGGEGLELDYASPNSSRQPVSEAMLQHIGE